MTQLEEQGRFIRFEADQYHLMRSKQMGTKRANLGEHRHQIEAAQRRHADALTSLEHRHLSAEVDLERALEIERQGCETRLKHMQAYCNPKPTVEGMPNRIITKQHYRQLEQQYHVRNGMENLHAARINVLREKQGKQVERILGKQELELEELKNQLTQKMEELESSFKAEERMLRREFSERKKRLVARWTLAEAIERKKLEKETDDTYGPLPAVAWGERRSENGKEEVNAEESFANDAMMAYDAATLNMI